MKQHALLRRALPLVLLVAVLFTSALPASASLFGRSEGAGEAAVSALAKNGPVGGVVSFSSEDFKLTPGSKATLESIVITALPDVSTGALVLGGRELAVGDEVAMSAVDGLRFLSAAAPGADFAAFTFTPVFDGGSAGEEVSAQIHLLSAANGAPVAENLEMSTYKNVAVTGRFTATDPEGDLLTFQLLSKPARGAVTMPEDGSSDFVYTPYENKTGKDSFTYVAIDAVGNASAPATVKMKIEKASTKVTYADMDGVPAYKAAIRLAEEGVFVGECMGGEYFFQPELGVSRGEFVAMAMNACGVEALEGVERTGFADDVSIPTWAKPYVSSALKSGLVQGTQNEAGQVVFNADSSITRAEASVLLDRMLQITDVAEPTLAASDAPAWASQSAANLASCGVIRPDSSGALTLGGTMTRADAAELLCGALEVLDQRDGGGWFHW